MWVKHSDDESNLTKRSGHRWASKYSGHRATPPLAAGGGYQLNTVPLYTVHAGGGGYQLNSLPHQILQLLQDTLFLSHQMFISILREFELF